MFDLPTIPIRPHRPPARVRPYVRPRCVWCNAPAGLHTLLAGGGRHQRCPVDRSQ
ncbi:hypothetical protein [Nocardia testacea]|uniref:hypothetical protein n=1 Tax=Nocardia testacea TaxID=248551 RepID=UPI0002E00A73|nr:hypothetical protein [Nocardia testacea]